MIFLALLSIPLMIVLAAFFLSKEISVKELAIQLGAQVIVVIISVFVCYYANTTDTETWNGIVSSKRSDKVSCSHSYACNPHPCSCDSKGSCSTCYDTCYEHSYDIDWNIFTSNGETITIERVDNQGVIPPNRWISVAIGEPTSVSHSYENYIKGSPGTLFRKTGQSEQYSGLFPSYPQIYDYYKMDRLIADVGLVTESHLWNRDLALINSRLGSRKQVNAMVLITKYPRDFFFALEEQWIGGKKNDAILVIGVDSDLRPIWTEVMAWTNNESFKVVLKDEVLNLPKIERESTLSVFEKNIVSLYERKPMQDFEYLKSSIVPTTAQWIVSILIGILIAVGLSWYFHMNDPFGDRFYYRRNRMY